jgi:DNA-binding response OmpR family regulator
MATLKIKILSVDDNAQMAEILANLLAGSGYETVHFFDANGALEWLKTHTPELIISDMNMPGLSGAQFCKMLKSDPSTASIPLIMLTAVGDEINKVQSLKTGADDYVIKPVSGNELLARVEALLRRCYHRGQTDRLLVSGSLILDMDTGDVSTGEKKIVLLPKEFALLSMFLKHKGHILEYSFIAEAVWGFNSVATKDTMKVTIHRLKAKLGEYADCVEPVSGLGYKWVEK